MMKSIEYDNKKAYLGWKALSRTTLLSWCLLFFLLIPQYVMAQAKEDSFVRQNYVIVSGENLSKVVYGILGSPLYGPHGHLAEVIQMNKHIKNPDRLLPGEIIVIKVPAIPLRMNASEENLPASVKPLLPETSVASPAEVDKSSALLSFGFGYTVVGLDSTETLTGSRALINSNPSLGFNLAYQQNWSEKFATTFDFKLLQARFIHPIDFAGSMKGDSQDFSSSAVGFKYSWDLRHRMAAFASYTQQAFVNGISTNVLQIDKANILGLSTQYEQSLLSSGSMTFDLKLGVGYLGSASVGTYTVKSGTNYWGGFAFSQKISHQSGFSFDVAYKGSQQDTSVNTQSAAELNKALKWFLLFGEQP